MKIRIFSDVHLEAANFRPPEMEQNVVVLAGDIHPGLKGIEWAKFTFPDVPVVYVPGNHEFYGLRELHKTIGEMREFANGTNVRFLYNDTTEIDGVKFSGCTLWTDYNLFGEQPMSMWHASRGMNDYQRIKWDKTRLLRPEDLLAEHESSKAWMEESLPGADIVVTHHAPTSLSILPEYQFDECTPCYASRMEDVIERHKPKVWFHGHVHAAHDYMLHDTRIVVNARGYHGYEKVQGFDPAKIVDL